MPDPDAAVTPQHAIEVLNRAFVNDPDGVAALISYRVSTTKAMADDPTIQVGINEFGTYRVGLLGIINGIFDINNDGAGWIAAIVDEEGPRKLRGFKLNVSS